MMDWITDITFMYPLVLIGLVLIPILVVWYVFRHQRNHPHFQLSFGGTIKKDLQSIRGRLIHGLFVFRLLALGLIIVALARPVLPQYESEIETEGINIVMALDISSSMLARDFKPNRLEAAKELATEFIEERPNDRIGLVVFSGESFTQCPLTVDHSILLNFMDDIKTGLLEDGTAIGSGLGTAVNRLKDGAGSSKVIILLTDGVNNAGSVDPMTAADLATTYGIRVYTVGVGSKGKAYSPVALRPDGSYVFDYVEVEIDEELLNDIATKTGAQYFRATDKESLREVYAQIDEMEKSRVKVSTLPKPIDKFQWFLMVAAGFFALELLLKFTILRTFAG